MQIVIRYRGNSATQANNPEFKVRFKKAASGTVPDSTGIRPASTTWVTNTNAVPRNHPLTLYQNPVATSLMSATLDTSQVGLSVSAAGNGTDVVRVTSVWELLDYSPGTSPPAGDTRPFFAFF